METTNHFKYNIIEIANKIEGQRNKSKHLAVQCVYHVGNERKRPYEVTTGITSLPRLDWTLPSTE